MIRDESDLRELLARVPPADPAPVRFAAVVARAEQLRRRRTQTWSLAGALTSAVVVASVVSSSRWTRGGQGGPAGSPPAAAVGPTGSIVDPLGPPMSTIGLVTATGVLLVAVLAALLLGRSAALPGPIAVTEGGPVRPVRRAITLGAALVGSTTTGVALQVLLLMDAFTTRTVTPDHTAMVLRVGLLGALGSVVCVVVCAALVDRRPSALLWPLGLQVGAGFAGWSGSLVLIWVVQDPVPSSTQWQILAWIWIFGAAGFVTAWVSSAALVGVRRGVDERTARTLVRALRPTVGVTSVWAATSELLRLWSEVRLADGWATLQGYLQAGPGRVLLAVSVVLAILSAVGGRLVTVHPALARPDGGGRSGRSLRAGTLWQVLALGSAVAAASFLEVAVRDWERSSLSWAMAASVCWAICASSVWLAGANGRDRLRSS